MANIPHSFHSLAAVLSSRSVRPYSGHEHRCAMLLIQFCGLPHAAWQYRHTPAVSHLSGMSPKGDALCFFKNRVFLCSSIVSLEHIHREVGTQSLRSWGHSKIAGLPAKLGSYSNTSLSSLSLVTAASPANTWPAWPT